MKCRRKKRLAVFLTIAVFLCSAVPSIANDGGSEYAEALKQDDGSAILTVFEQEGVDGEAKLVKEYSLTRLDQMAEHDAQYGYEFMKNNSWAVWATSVCTPLETILSDCGVSFNDGDQIIVEAEDGFSYTLTTEVYQRAVNFYPSVTEENLTNMENEITVPCVIGICWDGALTVKGGKNAGEIRDSLLESSYYSKSLRLFLGSKSDDFYQAGSSGGREATSTVAGNRSVNGVSSITVVHDSSYDYLVEYMSREDKPYQNFYLKEGATVPVPDTHPNVPEEIGSEQEYEFDYWYRLENGKEIQYEPGVIVSKNLRFYPKWKKTGGDGSGEQGTTPGKETDNHQKDCLLKNFADLNPEFWYHSAVDYVLGHNYFNGVSDTKFEPDGSMTRAMFVTVLSRIEGIDAAQYTGSDFSDVVEGQWYSAAVQWASRSGIVQGTGEGVFGPDGNVTREQMAAIMYRYAQYKKQDTSGADASKFNAFTDKSSVSGWAEDALIWATDAGIINGMGDGTLAPGNGSTRVQVAQIVKNYCDREA